MPYEKIFSPLSVRTLTVKNRILRFPSRGAMVQEILSVYTPQTFQ